MIEIKEKMKCDICRKHAPLQEIEFAYSVKHEILGIKTTKVIFLEVCDSCFRQLLIYDVAAENGSKTFGSKFSEIQNRYSLDFNTIRKTVDRSEWAEVREKSNGSRIQISDEWNDLKRVLRDN